MGGKGANVVVSRRVAGKLRAQLNNALDAAQERDRRIHELEREADAAEKRFHLRISEVAHERDEAKAAAKKAKAKAQQMETKYLMMDEDYLALKITRDGLVHAAELHHCDPCRLGKHGECCNSMGCEGCCPDCHTAPARLAQAAIAEQGGKTQ